MIVLPLGSDLFMITHSSPGLSFLSALQVRSEHSRALLRLCSHSTGLFKVYFCCACLPALHVIWVSDSVLNDLMPQNGGKALASANTFNFTLVTLAN